MLDSQADGSMVLDVGGVGYELVTPIGTMGRVTADAEGQLILHVHTHVREDALELFGFASADERVAFRTLISISKVGPKLALAVLGAVGAHELAQLVETGQVTLLTKVPGVGKKTAQRIVLELKGKLSASGAAPRPANRPGGADAHGGQASVLAAALVRMGFKQAESERAINSIDDLERPMNELVRDALAVLSP